MIKKIPTTIHLMGKSFTLKCPENETENLKQATVKLNHHLENTKKQFKSLDDFETLLLAAIQVSHELVTNDSKQEQQNKHLSQLIDSLEKKINRNYSVKHE